MLAMVVGSANERWDVNLHGHDGSVRSFPVTDIDAVDTERFKVVFAAALTMTAAKTPIEKKVSATGIDIEAT